MNKLLLLVLTCLAPAAVAQSTVFTDTFTGSTWTNLTSHTSDSGGTYIVAPYNTAVATANKMVLTGDNHVTITGPNFTNYEVPNVNLNGCVTVCTYTAQFTVVGSNVNTLYMGLVNSAGAGYMLLTNTNNNALPSTVQLVTSQASMAFYPVLATSLNNTISAAGVYTAILTYLAGAPATMTATIKNSAGTVLWASGNVTDTLVESGISTIFLGGWGTGNGYASYNNGKATVFTSLNVSAAQTPAALTTAQVFLDSSKTNQLIEIDGASPSTCWTATPPTITANVGTVNSVTANTCTQAHVNYTPPASSIGTVTLTNTTDSVSTPTIQYALPAATTMINDTMAGTSGADLATHTAPTGNSWTNYTAASSCTGSGTLLLDGSGGLYTVETGGAVAANYRPSGTFFFSQANATGYTVTWSWVVHSVLGANNAIYIPSTATQTAGFGAKITNTNISVGLMSLSACGQSSINTPWNSVTLTPSGTYNGTMTVTSNGTTATAVISIVNGSTTILSGTYTSTVDPVLQGIPVLGQAGGTTATTGIHTAGFAVSYASIPVTYNNSAPFSVFGQPTTMNITGNATGWGPSTTFSMSGGTINSQSVANANLATVVYTPTDQSYGSSVTLTDSTDSVSETIPVGIPMTDTGVWCTPGNWYINTPTAPFGALSNNPGAYCYVSFTVSATSTVSLFVGHPYPGMPGETQGNWVRYSIDSGPFTDVNILNTSTRIIALTPTVASGTHVLKFYFRAEDTAYDQWMGPDTALIVHGVGISTAATTSAPAHLANQCLMNGDSRPQGFNALATASTGGISSVNDATVSAGLLFGQTLNCEVSLVAYAGLGWYVAPINTPPLYLSYPYQYNGVARSLSGFQYIATENMGSNDNTFGSGQDNVTSSMGTYLAGVRAANPTATILVNSSWDGLYGTIVQNGFNVYISSSHDTNAFTFGTGLTTSQMQAITGPTTPGSYGAPYDHLHPTAYMHSIIAAGIANALSVILTPPIFVSAGPQ